VAGAPIQLPGLANGYGKIEQSLGLLTERMAGIEGALRQQAERLTRIERGLGDR
jgi:hypothetical protein